MQPQAIFSVTVNGQDVSSRFAPVIKSIKVVLTHGKADTAALEIADPRGQTYMPDTDAKIEISLGHKDKGAGLVFRGKVDRVRSKGSKKSGRVISVTATGLDQKTKAKEKARRHADNKSFGDVAKDWGSKAGLDSILVHPDLASIRRAYWAMQHESFIHWARRIAADLGAAFTISKNQGIFTPLSAASTASGQALPTIKATWGDNLISWDVEPARARPQHKKLTGKWYDYDKAAEIEESENDDDADGTATHHRHHRHGTKDAATQGASGDKKKHKRDKGAGTVVILGDPSARPESPLEISGARPGVDGPYKLKSVTHEYSKRAGYNAHCSLADPGTGAGKDSRAKKTPSSPASVPTPTPRPDASSTISNGIV